MAFPTDSRDYYSFRILKSLTSAFEDPSLRRYFTVHVAYLAAETASFLKFRSWCLRENNFFEEDVIPHTKYRRGQTKRFYVFLDQAEFSDSYGRTCHVKRSYLYSGVYYFHSSSTHRASSEGEGSWTSFH